MLQVCARQEAGIEAAIHSMNMKYEDESTDASNVLSSLNRQSFLHNVSYLQPSISIFVKNC